MKDSTNNHKACPEFNKTMSKGDLEQSLNQLIEESSNIVERDYLELLQHVKINKEIKISGCIVVSVEFIKEWQGWQVGELATVHYSRGPEPEINITK